LSTGKDLIKDQMIMHVWYVDTRRLYFIGQRYEATDSPPVSTLYKWEGWQTDQNSIKKIETDISSTGYIYQVAYDSRDKKVVTLAGDKILVFDRDDTLKKEFFNTDLGGSAYSLALTDSAGGGREPDNDDSSGCNAGLTMFAALLFVLPLALRKKSR
jgi:Synergist-CTERM protein sorting domain-containing protein